MPVRGLLVASSMWFYGPSVSPLFGRVQALILGVYLVGGRDARIRLLGLRSWVSGRYFVPFFLLVQGLLAYVYVPSALGISFGTHVVGCLVGAFVSLSYTAIQISNDQELTGSA